MKKSDYVVLGTITHMASNGLMVFSNGKNTGHISDGKIGDVIVRRKDETGLEVQIFSPEEWAAVGVEEPKGKKNADKAKKARGTDRDGGADANVEDDSGDEEDANAGENVLNLSSEAAREGE